MELRLLKNIDGQTKNKNVTLDKLYNSGFYGRVCDMWEKSFLSITQQSGCFPAKKAKTTREQIEKGFVSALKEKNETERKNFINRMISECATKQERYRLKKRINTLWEKYTEADDTTKKIYNAFQQLIKSNKAVS